MKTDDTQLAAKDNNTASLEYESGAESTKKKEVELNSNSPGVWGLRFSLLVMISLWFLCIIFRYVDVEWGNVDCELSNTDDIAEGICIRQNTVYRVTAVVCVFFSVHGVLSFIFADALFDNYWLFVKLPLLALGAFALIFFTGSNFFDDALFVWWARIGAFIFIVFQQVILLDFAYMWNETWLTYSSATNNAYVQEIVSDSDCHKIWSNIWLLAILIVAAAFFGVFIAGMVALFYYYGGDGCSTSNTIITITMLGMLAAGVLQLASSNGSLLTTTILMVYVTYITYAAVALNPDPDCNPFAATDSHAQSSYGTGPAIAGIIISLVSIVYMSTITTRAITAVLAAGGATQSAVNGVILGRNSGASRSGPDMNRRLRSSVFFYNIVYAFLGLYLSMIMTNWGLRISSLEQANPDTSRVAMWMQASAAWITIVFYVVALVAPIFDNLPKSVWDFYPSWGGKR